jgi:hypothetical protein
LTPSHDAGLASATEKVNRILDRVAAQGGGSSRCLRFVVTEYGPLLAWTRCGGNDDARPAGQSEITLEREPARFYQTLGLSVEGRQAQKGHWEKHEDGWLYCHAKKKGQYHCRLLQPDAPSAVFDASLMECTAQLNAIFEECAKAKNDPKLELCLLATPAGLLLAWTRDAHSEETAGPDAVTAESPENVIYDALGLARPAGEGGPPWQFILPAVAVGAAAFAGVIIACAAGAFDGGDSSSPDATPSATARVTQATVRATRTVTPTTATDLPTDATPTVASEPTSPAEPTLAPSATVPPEPTSNLEPTRVPTRPAATPTSRIPPQT